MNVRSLGLIFSYLIITDSSSTTSRINTSIMLSYSMNQKKVHNSWQRLVSVNVVGRPRWGSLWVAEGRRGDPLVVTRCRAKRRPVVQRLSLRTSKTSLGPFQPTERQWRRSSFDHDDDDAVSTKLSPGKPRLKRRLPASSSLLSGNNCRHARWHHTELGKPTSAVSQRIRDGNRTKFSLHLGLSRVLRYSNSSSSKKSKYLGNFISKNMFFFHTSYSRSVTVLSFQNYYDNSINILWTHVYICGLFWYILRNDSFKFLESMFTQ